jgi:Na+-translocating membrane potential-generating system (MpsC)
METARLTLDAMVQDKTGVKVVSLHHDIRTVTGEEIMLFTLASSPVSREIKRLSLTSADGGKPCYDLSICTAADCGTQTYSASDVMSGGCFTRCACLFRPHWAMS